MQGGQGLHGGSGLLNAGAGKGKGSVWNPESERGAFVLGAANLMV